MAESDLPNKGEILVLGVGILGASVALHARRLGREVLAIDRGPIGAETSS